MLLPFGPVEEIVKVLTLGAKKYAPDNWQKVPEAERRYPAALLRHVVARLNGERLDPETGHSHLAHAGCCLLFWMWFDARRAPVAPSATEIQEHVAQLLADLRGKGL